MQRTWKKVPSYIGEDGCRYSMSRREGMVNRGVWGQIEKEARESF